MSSFIDVPEDMLPTCAILTDDPMRVEMFAAHYLEQAKLYTRQRGMTGYTGCYAGVPVVVQAVGYGGASLKVYLHELVSLYGIRIVIYAGECVSREASLQLHDMVLASKAYAREGALEADARLLKNAVSAARKCSITVRTSMVHTDDTYGTHEMEPCCTRACIVDYAAFDLYQYAGEHDVAALSILEVSEQSGICVAPAERQSRFHGLARLAFETVAFLREPE